MVKVAGFQELLVSLDKGERQRQSQRKAEFLAQFPAERVVSITDITLEDKGSTYANITYVYYD